MKRFLPILACLLFAASAAHAQAPVITEGTPVVNQGQTLQFHETNGDAGTWAMSGTHAGSITTGGLYTAPATVTPNQSAGGYQVLPNNSIFNQRVDSLPLRADSATLMAGVGTGSIVYREMFSFPLNYCDNTTPTVAINFHFTPSANANFEFPVYPNARLESGWLNRWDGNRDHHFICIDTTTGQVGEIYQYRPVLTTTAAVVSSNVATLTFASDPSTAGAGYVVGETAVIDGFTGPDAFFNQASGVTLTAVTSSTVSYALTHANATATSNGKMGTIADCPSAGLTDCNSGGGVQYLNSTYNLPNSSTGGGSTDAAGLPLVPLMLKVQEMEQAIATGGTIKHMLRMTLRNNFICGSSTANACYSGQPGGIRHIWPATAEAFAGSGINPYGLVYRLKSSFNCTTFSSIAQILCTELKQYGLILADGGTDWSVIGEAGKWPANIIAAFQEMENANIQASTNFEVPDLLSIQGTSSQTCPTPGNCNLTTVTPERVCFTRTSDSAVACVDVALMGVAVNLPHDSIDVQAGSAALQLTAFVHGGTNNTVTWSVSPAITGGSLTSGGLLTPPASIGAVTSYTVTATSTDNASVAATMNLNIYPTGSIFIRPAAPLNFTDSFGHVWASTGGSGQWLGCCGDLSGANWGTLVNPQIYYYRASMFDDDFFDFYVPNGSYKVTVKLATDQASPGGTGVGLGVGSNLAYPYEDVFTAAGGNFKPADFVMTYTVSNGVLPIRVWQPQANGSSGIINAIQVDLTSSPGIVPLAPPRAPVLLLANVDRAWPNVKLVSSVGQGQEGHLP